MSHSYVWRGLRKNEAERTGMAEKRIFGTRWRLHDNIMFNSRLWEGKALIVLGSQQTGLNFCVCSNQLRVEKRKERRSNWSKYKHSVPSDPVSGAVARPTHFDITVGHRLVSGRNPVRANFIRRKTLSDGEVGPEVSYNSAWHLLGASTQEHFQYHQPCLGLLPATDS